jgi:hypothetical protein
MQFTIVATRGDKSYKYQIDRFMHYAEYGCCVRYQNTVTSANLSSASEFWIGW